MTPQEAIVEFDLILKEYTLIVEQVAKSLGAIEDDATAQQAADNLRESVKQ